jgi:hypothetical protein
MHLNKEKPSEFKILPDFGVLNMGSYTVVGKKDKT